MSTGEVDFLGDESMRISREAICQSLFVEGRGALKREMVTCLGTGRALREPRARSRNKPHAHEVGKAGMAARTTSSEAGPK